MKKFKARPINWKYSGEDFVSGSLLKESGHVYIVQKGTVNSCKIMVDPATVQELIGKLAK